MKKHLLVIVMVFLGFMPLAAATVSVLIIETGPSQPGTSSSSSVWESGVMDAFFDAGHIVSNAPILRLDEVTGSNSKLPEEARRDFEEARQGGSDFFVMVHINYPDAFINEAEQSKKISIAIFRISTRELIYEGSMVDRIWKDPKEEFSVAKRNVGQIINQLRGKLI